MPRIQHVEWSAKARLTFVFTFLFGIIVAALAVSTYLLMRHEVHSKLNSVLETAIGATEMSSEHEIGENGTQEKAEDDVRSVLSDSQSKALAQTQIYIVQGSRIVAYKPDSRHQPPISLTDLASGTGKNDMVVAHDRLLAPKFNTSYEVVAATSAQPANQYLARLRRTLLLALLLGLAVAAYGGYLAAESSLRPLSELNRTIDEVTSADLSARVRTSSKGGEIGRLASSFNALLDRLEHVFSAQRRFMTDASHELRTPVTVALTAAQVATRNLNHSLRDCEESLETIEEQMLRLRRIIQDMFFLSQADSSSLNMRMQPLFLDDVVGDAIRAARTLATAKKQMIKVTALPEARCIGDVDLLKQAVLILLENAVKFTPAAGNIEVTLLQRGKHWVCRVCDSGIGISEAAQAHIFERFYRDPENINTKTPGAGLGLSIGKSIVEAHHGTLALIESRPGYTCFEIALPTVQSENVSPADQANSLAVNI